MKEMLLEKAGKGGHNFMLTRKKEAQTLHPKKEIIAMETKMFTAIFVVVLIAVGGVGISVAMPEDVEYMVTPQERAQVYLAEYFESRAALDRAVEAGQITAYQAITRITALHHKTQAKIDNYVKLYEILSEQIWSTDEGLVDVGNSSIWIGRTGISVGYDEVVVVVPYMQRQVDNKVAELETNEANKNIDVEIVIERIMYTYPGGPIFILYHFEVTYDIYEYLYE